MKVVQYHPDPADDPAADRFLFALLSGVDRSVCALLERWGLPDVVYVETNHVASDAEDSACTLLGVPLVWHSYAVRRLGYT